VAADPASYSSLIGTNNVAQNSWNMEFFDSASFPFDGRTPGIYDFALSASDATGAELARTEIRINAVPAPATLLLFGSCLALLGYRVRARTA
jgi:hypothetical protein